MPRYALTEYEDATPDVRAIYDDYHRSTGALRLPNWLKSLGHTGASARGYWEKTKGCLVQGALPLFLKELVVFIVSVRNGTPYCTACHAHAALSLDPSLTFDDLHAIARDIDGADLPAATRAALRFAAKMADGPADVTDADFRAIADAGFTRAQVNEILGAIDVAVMFNTYTMGVRLEIDAEYRPFLETAGGARRAAA